MDFIAFWKFQINPLSSTQKDIAVVSKKLSAFILTLSTMYVAIRMLAYIIYNSTSRVK